MSEINIQQKIIKNEFGFTKEEAQK